MSDDRAQVMGPNMLMLLLTLLVLVLIVAANVVPEVLP